MLRINILEEPQGTRFKLEGKLAHEWVAEAERVWTALSALGLSKRIVVDLCGVSFVDDLGRELLVQMHSSGAQLIGTGPMSSALIEEICGDDPPADRTWIRSVLSLLFLLLLAGAVFGKNGLFYRPQTLPSGDVASSIQERIVPGTPAGAAQICSKR